MQVETPSGCGHQIHDLAWEGLYIVIRRGDRSSSSVPEDPGEFKVQAQVSR